MPIKHRNRQTLIVCDQCGGSSFECTGTLVETIRIANTAGWYTKDREWFTCPVCVSLNSERYERNREEVALLIRDGQFQKVADIVTGKAQYVP